jgi:hypothetical protein
MSDVRHRTTEEARATLQRFIDVAWGNREVGPLFTIPVNRERDADCILSDVITERDVLADLLGEIAAQLQRPISGTMFPQNSGVFGYWLIERVLAERLVALAGTKEPAV